MLLSISPQLLGQETKNFILAHDPVIAQENNTYYLYSTGQGIKVSSSKDLKSWTQEKPVFQEPPAWAVKAVPGFKGHIWAPDISFFNGKYFLYYSISTFGKNTSCIGLATNITLNPRDKNYHWEDHGKIIESVSGKTNWNAIDPNLAVDRKGVAYLTFGSFWDGIKIIKLDKSRLQPAETLDNLKTIGSRLRKDHRNRTVTLSRTNPNPIEAPFIYRKGKYYYLFASIDYCCRGPESTYKIIVGRSKKITGPYLDRQKIPMAEGGGTILLQGDQDWYGVGHNSVNNFDGVDYLIFHGYDAGNKGKAALRIEKLSWDNFGWPVVLSEK